MQTEADVEDKKEELAQSLFDHIPVGVGSQGIIPTTASDLEASLEMGMDWSLREVAPSCCYAQLRRQTCTFHAQRSACGMLFTCPCACREGLPAGQGCKVQCLAQQCHH